MSCDIPERDDEKPTVAFHHFVTVIYRISCTLFVCLLICSLVSCSLFGPSEGTLSIQLDGADIHSGKMFHYTLYIDNARASSWETDPEYAGSAVISGGAVNITIDDIPGAGGVPVLFDGGRQFALDGFIDADDSGGDPLGGIDYELRKQYDGEIDGDTVAVVHYPGDFILSNAGDPYVVLYVEEEAYPQGFSLDFGTTYRNLNWDADIIIKNSGTALLELTGSPKVMLSGSGSAVFSIDELPAASTIMPGESLTFRLSVDTSTAGLYSAIITIPYNRDSGIAYNNTMNITINQPTLQLPKTGQTVSSLAGDDGDLEAGAAWPTARFVDNEDGTVSDTMTGLMWQGVPEYSVMYSSGYTWDFAVVNFVDIKNSANYCGYNDWHLPNVNELMSLVHAGQNPISTWLNSLDGFSGIRGDRFWTSTRSYSSGFYSYMSHIVYFSDGSLWRLSSNAISRAQVILVREISPGSITIPKTGKTSMARQNDDGGLELGVAWPFPRFVEQDGMVFDALTGLLWKQTPKSTAVTWSDAIAYAEGLDFGGYTDWRVPNRSEMRSLVSYGVSSNSSYLSGQFGAEIPDNKLFWTSTTFTSQYGDGSAWVLALETGTSDNAAKSELKYCWVVREP